MSLSLAKCFGHWNAAEKYHVDSDQRSQEALQFTILWYFCFWDLCHLHLLIRQSCVWWEMQPNYLHWLSQQMANHGHLSEAILNCSNARRHVAKSICMRAQRHWPNCPDQKDCSAYRENHKRSESSGLKWHLGLWVSWKSNLIQVG